MIENKHKTGQNAYWNLRNKDDAVFCADLYDKVSEEYELRYRDKNVPERIRIIADKLNNLYVAAISDAWDCTKLKQYKLSVYKMGNDEKTKYPRYKGARVVASISFMTYENGNEDNGKKDYCKIEYVFVEPRFQGMGIAGLMMRQTLDFLRNIMPNSDIMLSADGEQLEHHVLQYPIDTQSEDVHEFRSKNFQDLISFYSSYGFKPIKESERPEFSVRMVNDGSRKEKQGLNFFINGRATLAISETKGLTK